ncbi:hypothetical protein WN55_00220 [Dufourea novaeangliae]|uniref:Uncharacterized protein n=1 Tax=Dufourea novaeangliae TaxID=178035 RepID=A0A154PE48_DUFNO|nr:hypothetical protein WN55_00220 [Dufourea novaeangliae]
MRPPRLSDEMTRKSAGRKLLRGTSEHGDSGCCRCGLGNHVSPDVAWSEGSLRKSIEKILLDSDIIFIFNRSIESVEQRAIAATGCASASTLQADSTSESSVVNKSLPETPKSNKLPRRVTPRTSNYSIRLANGQLQSSTKDDSPAALPPSVEPRRQLEVHGGAGSAMEVSRQRSRGISGRNVAATRGEKSRYLDQNLDRIGCGGSHALQRAAKERETEVREARRRWRDTALRPKERERQRKRENREKQNGGSRVSERARPTPSCSCLPPTACNFLAKALMRGLARDGRSPRTSTE